MPFDPGRLDEAARVLGFDRPTSAGSSPFNESTAAATGDFVDAAVRRFAKTNLQFVDGSSLAFQDPTFLGFKLMFLFDQPESGLLSTVPHPNTAIGYLERIGDADRAYFLKQFVNLLRDINTQCPWYWQTVEGLTDAWKREWEAEEFKPKYGTGFQKLSIGCLESVDLRVTALMDLYRKSCFDWEFKRAVVPWNLRQFTMFLYVYEGRSFNRKLTKTQQDQNRRLLGSTEDPGNDVEQINRLLFEFEMCEFLPDDSGEVLSKVSNGSLGEAYQKMSVRYTHVREKNIYNLFSDRYVADDIILRLDRAAVDDPSAVGPVVPQQDEVGLRDRLMEGLNELQGVAEDQARARAEGFVQSQVGRLVLGNLYGLSAASLVSGGAVGAAQAVARIAQGSGSSVANGSAEAGGRYFDAVTPNPVSDPSGSTYEDVKDPTGSPSGNLADGVSLQNVTGSAVGTVDGGASEQNDTGQSGGAVEQGVSVDNVELPPVGSIPPGAAAGNEEGVASGFVGGGASLQNEGGDATGSVGGGSSVGNSPGSPARNVFDSAQPSRANVDGSVSGSVGGGESVGNVEKEATGSAGGGESVKNDQPDDPRGKVGGGESMLNQPREPNGNIYKR